MKFHSLVASILLASTVVGTAAAEDRVVTLSVPDMTCKACTLNVKRALSRVDGVKNVTLIPTSQQAIVTFDDAKTTSEALVDVTGMAGYVATIKR